MAGRSLRSECRDKSEFALVAATKSGENHAFELLVERYEKRIFNLAYRITRNREAAQDAVQQSFQKGLVHLNSFHGKSLFSSWLTRIAINEALLCLRRKRALKEIPLEDARSEPEGELTVEAQDRGENPEEIKVDLRLGSRSEAPPRCCSRKVDTGLAPEAAGRNSRHGIRTPELKDAGSRMNAERAGRTKMSLTQRVVRLLAALYIYGLALLILVMFSRNTFSTLLRTFFLTQVR